MRALFLTPHPQEGPSTRYRVLQYLPYLKAEGIDCTVSPFLSTGFYHLAYQEGHWLKKGGFFLASSLRRLRDFILSGRYDVVFIHLEAFPIGPPLIEWLLSLRGVPMVFDLDDAIFLPNRSIANPLMKWLRMPQKVETILRLSRCVTTTNPHLREYVQRFNPNAALLPTCVDVRQFNVLSSKPPRPRPLIGWVGSHSTFPYLEMLKPVLTRLARRQEFTFKIVGSEYPFQLPGVEVVQEFWRLDREVAHFQELDIGVYPLPSDPWVLGKAGFKAIQYMAVGIPCVVSDIGRNQEIVQDGVNGFLADAPEEWCEKLEKLLKNPGMRLQLGSQGRKTVEQHFAVHLYAPAFAQILRWAAGRQDGKFPNPLLSGKMSS